MTDHPQTPIIPVHVIGENAQAGGKAIMPLSSEQLRFQAKFAQAGMHTIQFTVLDPNRANGNQPSNLINGEVVRAKAEITWSLGGQNIKRVVDCFSGMSISGESESVDVIITDRSILETNPPPPRFFPIQPYTVQVVAAEGTRPAVEQPPQFTGDTILINPAAPAGTQIDVPEGAISAWVVIAPQVIGAVLLPEQHIVRQRASGGMILRAYSPLDYNGFVPLANGCTVLTFEQSALQTAPIYYFTAFGIDG
ncbi:MAG TPA: hypothetical protein VF077_09540 [Nitrospiraceae bacterium]